MKRFFMVSVIFTCSVVLAGQTSTLSFTNDARGAYPSTLTYSGGVITVDMSALPDGVQVYRAILVHDRGGNSGSFPPSNRSYQPLQVEASDDTGNWLQTVPPRHYHLDCTEATQRAVSGNPKTLTLNVISFAQLDSSPYIRVDVWCDKPTVHAIGQVTGIGVRHQDGDTMITFTENGPFMTDPASTVGDYKAALASTDSPDCVRYRIYRSSSPIDATGIRTAELVDEIKPLSNWSIFYYNGNQYVTDADPCIRLPVDDETPAATDQGIYVRRAQAAASAYYAVSKVVNGEENLSNWTASQNCSSSAMTESVGTGMVLLREKVLGTDFMFVTGADLYYYVRWECPPCYNMPSTVWDYLVAVPPTAADPRPVDIALHCWGGWLNGGYGWWYEAEQGALMLATNMAPYDWWTAFHDNYGTIRPFTNVDGNGGGVVRNYPEKRLLSFLNNFVKANWNVDDNRILVTGSSMGGSGCLMWGARQADVFAYSNGWVGVYIPRETPQFFGSFEGVFGMDDWDCQYESTGMEAFDYWDTAAHILADPGREMPFLCTANGKNDTQIGWNQAWKTISALQTTRQPHKFRWGQGGHSERAVLPGESPSDRYIGITIARNQSVPAFTNCSQDDNMGNGDPADGDLEGNINRYLLWQTSDIVDQVGRWEMTVYLIGASPDASCTVDLTPRRCQAFTPSPGTNCDWTNTDVTTSGQVGSGTVTTDAYGLVTLSGITVSKNKNRIVITHAGGGDTVAPQVDVTDYSLAGTAFDDSGTVSVTVAGSPVTVSGPGDWTSPDLAIAQSPVAVVAEDPSTNQTSITVTVTAP